LIPKRFNSLLTRKKGYTFGTYPAAIPAFTPFIIFDEYNLITADLTRAHILHLGLHTGDTPLLTGSRQN
jgi:hypothetical protein